MVEANIHMSKIHSAERKKEFKCTICEKEFYTKPSQKLHMKTCQKPKEFFECNLCHKTFTRKLNFEKHRKYRHVSQVLPKEIRCDLCNYSSNAMHANLSKHVKEVHEKKKSHKCNFCSLTFTRPWSVRLHIKRIHLTGPRNYNARFM